MATTSPRPFTIADAMVLVAMLAPAWVLLRIAVGFGLFTSNPATKPLPGRMFIEYLSLSGGCLLICSTLAVLTLSLRQPWPPIREVIGGPGLVACIAAMTAGVLPLAYFLVGVLISHGLVANLVTPFGNIFGRWIAVAGPMVL